MLKSDTNYLCRDAPPATRGSLLLKSTDQGGGAVSRISLANCDHSHPPFQSGWMLKANQRDFSLSKWELAGTIPELAWNDFQVVGWVMVVGQPLKGC